MRLTVHLKACLILLIPSLFAAGCKKEKEDDDDPVSSSYSETGKPGKLSLAFANSTPANLVGDLVTPTYFGLKIISVELVNSDNSRSVAIWTNSACQPEEVKVGYEVEMTPAEIEVAREEIRKREGLSPEATIDPGTKKTVYYSYYDAQNCKATDIVNFLNLARPSSDVNNELNSQGLPVPPDTYTSVKLNLCNPTIDTSSFKAQKLQTAGMSSAAEVTGSGCGVTGAPTSQIVVNAGDTATVELAYDVSSLVEKTTWPSLATLPDPSANTNCYLDEPALTYYCSKLGADKIVPSLVSAD